MTAVGELLRVYRNEPIIEKGTQPTFDWKDGLKGESTPDRVIVPAVEPVDLWTLIRELTGIADSGVGFRIAAEAVDEAKPARRLDLSDIAREEEKEVIRHPWPL